MMCTLYRCYSSRITLALTASWQSSQIVDYSLVGVVLKSELTDFGLSFVE